MKQRTRHDNPLPSLVLSVLLGLLDVSVSLVLLSLSVPLVLLVLSVLLVLLDSYVPLVLLVLSVPLVLLVPLIPSPSAALLPLGGGREGASRGGRSGGGWGRLGRAAGCVGWELWLGGAGCGLWVPTQTKKPSGISLEGLLSKKGGYLLSHGCAVPSARAGLTSLFGMGRGGTPPL